MKFIKITSLVACLFLASCMNATNDKLDTMNSNMNRMATQVEADQTQIQSINDNSGRIAKETEVYEDSIKTLAEQLKVIAQTATGFQKMGTDVEDMLKETFKPAPATPTSNIDEVLGGMPSNPASPAPVKGNSPAIVNQSTVAVSQPVPSSPTAVTPSSFIPGNPNAPGATQLSDSFCVGTSLQRVHSDITNYDGLLNIPGAKYEPVAAVGPLLQMVKSQSHFVTKTATQTDAALWLVLQPTNLTDSRLYPRFLLRCTSLWSDQNTFNHDCMMYQDKEHFGLSNFVSHIHGDLNGCGNGQVKVNYTVILTANESDVQAIKTAALARLGILAGVVDHLFNEQLFFQAYFRNLFTNWIQGVQ